MDPRRRRPGIAAGRRRPEQAGPTRRRVGAQQIDECIEPAGVEAVVRLVEHQQLGRAEERGAETGAAALTERHPLDRQVAQLVQAERLAQRGWWRGRSLAWL